MEKIHIHDKYFVPFIPQERLESVIGELAAKLNADFAGRTDESDVPMLLCVLNGAIVFTGQLLKHLDFPLQLVSMKLSSYVGTKSTGKVKEDLPLTADVSGRTVIICEDIVDTGNTIVALKQTLLDKGAKDVRICTMLLKPEVFRNKAKLDYVGMEIPNRFIVGYGLDYDEQGRNLKDIFVLDE